MAFQPTTSPFRTRVFEIVRMIPRGRVMTYGQVALLCGLPRAAQAVGWTLHTAPADVPYQRVVNRHGGVASGYTDGGPSRHRAELEAEGVEVRDDDTVDLPRWQWWPSPEVVSALALPPDVIDRVAAFIDAPGERTVYKPKRSPLQ